MGNQKMYKSSGEFKGYLYDTQSAKIEINGIVSKILKLKSDKDGSHSNLPQYAGTSDMYFKRGKQGEVIQGRLFQNHQMMMDFDWGHDHKNADGTVFKKGTVHVQLSKSIGNGSVVRDSKNARLMTDREIEKYGPIIKHYAPYVRFR